MNLNLEDQAAEAKLKERHYADMAERLLPKVKKSSQPTKKPIVCPKCKEPAKSSKLLCAKCQKDHDFSTHCKRMLRNSKK